MTALRPIILSAVLTLCATETKAAFQSEIVFSEGNAGTRSALTLDSAGTPHACFAHWQPCTIFNSTAIRYGTRIGSTWTTETLMVNGCPLYGSSLAIVVDSNDEPHFLASAGRVDGEIMVNEVVHGHRTPGGWELEVLHTGSGLDLSLAIDANDALHLSYGRSGVLWYARRSNGSWNLEEVDVNESGHYTSLTLDSAGNPGIAFYSYQDNALHYAYPSGDSWSKELVDDSIDLVGCSSLATAPDGTIRIAYARTNGTLVHGVRSETGWMLEEIPGAGPAASEVKLVVGQDGNPVIFYFDMDAQQLYCAIQHSGQWATLIVDSNERVGANPSAVAAPGGQLHVTYYDAANQDLRYAFGTAVAGVGDQASSVRSSLVAFPNPSVQGRFDIPVADLDANEIVVRTPDGRVVDTDPIKPEAGVVRWKAVDPQGRPLPAGIYFLDLRSDGRPIGRARGVLIR